MSRPARLLAAGVVAACSSVAVWSVWVLRHPQRLWSMIDLRVFQWGGQMAQYHPPALYHGRFDHVLPFLYPPFAALGFAVLDALPFNGLQTLEAVTVIASVFAVVLLTLGMAARWRPEPMHPETRLAATFLVGAGALWLEPVQQTLAFGQVSAVLLLMVVADLALDDRRWFKGALIGIATGLKLTPGLFIVYLLLTRRFRAAAVAAASLLATVVVGFVDLPAPSREFWSPTGLQSIPSRIGVSNLQNQSINGYLARSWSTRETAHRMWLVAAALVGLVGLTAAVVLFRRYGDLGGMLATALVTLLVSPVSWTHYWIWVVPALAWGVQETWSRRRWRGALPLIVIAALFFAYPTRTNPTTGRWDSGVELLPKGLLWTVPWNDQREWTWEPWQQVVGNLYVIFGMTVLVVMARYSWRCWRASTDAGQSCNKLGRELSAQHTSRFSHQN